MATIKELAAYAGLSPSTVSIVLGGKAQERKIPPATCQRVLEAARALGYQPNLSARRLRDPKSRPGLVIGVFWAQDFRAPMMVRFLRGLRAAVQAYGGGSCEILIHPYMNGRLQAERSLTVLSAFNAAIICNASAEDLAWLEQAHLLLPIVLYNRPSSVYCSVQVDDGRFGALAAAAFARRGCRRAGVFHSDSVFSGMETRTESFIAGCRAAGIEVGPVVRCEPSMAGGCAAAAGLAALPAGERPDCLFCGSDALALGALRGFARAGLQLPRDLAMISVGNGEREAEEYACPSLAVIPIPMEEMAQECFKLLLRLVRGEGKPPFTTRLPLRYLPGETCPEEG